jgi:flagellar hook-associated protein 1 FlgK
MPGISNGIYTALSAVLAHSQTIEVIEHNVANVNTVGYRRQATVLSANVASSIIGGESGYGAGQRGGGVSVASIQRFSLDFFDGRYRSVIGGNQYWEAQRDILIQLEASLGETSDDGLIPNLDEFWGSWQALANDPSNTALRAAVLDDTRGLAESFNRRWEQLRQLRADQNQAVVSQVGEINAIADEIAELNGQIARVLSVGEQPNDLLDRRDVLLDRLAEMSGAVSSPQKNGETLVSINGHVLVMGHDALHLTTQPNSTDPTMVDVVWEKDVPSQPLTLSSGSLKGVLEVRDQVIPDQISGLNTLAQELMTRVNALHSAGYGLGDTPETGLNLFTGADASNIRLNALINTTNLAAAGAPAVAGEYEPGNNDMANAIAGLKDSKVMNSGTATLNDYYNAQVTKLAGLTSKAKENAANHALVAKALDAQRESVGGVSLDEEAANLAKAQRAYQAAARLLTAFDELLDTIINSMGLVGR